MPPARAEPVTVDTIARGQRPTHGELMRGGFETALMLVRLAANRIVAVSVVLRALERRGGRRCHGRRWWRIPPARAKPVGVFFALDLLKPERLAHRKPTAGAAKASVLLRGTAMRVVAVLERCSASKIRLDNDRHRW